MILAGQKPPGHSKGVSHTKSFRSCQAPALCVCNTKSLFKHKPDVAESGQPWLLAPAQPCSSTQQFTAPMALQTQIRLHNKLASDVRPAEGGRCIYCRAKLNNPHQTAISLFSLISSPEGLKVALLEAKQVGTRARPEDWGQILMVPLAMFLGSAETRTERKATEQVCFPCRQNQGM